MKTLTNQMRAGMSFRLLRMIPVPLALGTALLQFATLPSARAQTVQTVPARVLSPTAAADSQAIILSVSGKVEYSEDGTTFSPLKAFKEGATVRADSDDGSVKRLWEGSFKEGTVIRTGNEARVDIFLKRMATTVRLQPDSEMKIEKLATPREGSPAAVRAGLAVTKGNVVVAVRSLAAANTLEVRNAGGLAMIGGGGSKGRYLIAADGTPVVDKDSDVPLKYVRDTGVTVIPPGPKSLPKGDKPLPPEPSHSEEMLIQADGFEGFEGFTEPAGKP
jgi:hypothetical protein